MKNSLNVKLNEKLSEKLKVNTNVRKHLSRTAMLLLLLMMMALAACGTNDPNDLIGSNGSNGADHSAAEQSSATNGSDNADDNAGGNSSDNSLAEAATETQYPLTLQDVTGETVVIAQEPQRIVSLVPSETEVLFAVDAGARLVGVDEWSNYPEEASAIAKIGDLTANIESVADLQPDLVVASSSMNAAAIEQLRALSVTVYAGDPRTLDETIAHIERMGQIVNRQQVALEVAAGMREVKERVTTALAGAPQKRVYLEFSPGWSVGKGEFLDELVTLAGGVNIAGDQIGWFAIDEERVLESNPEVIIYPDIAGDQTIPELIMSRPGWQEIEAVKNDQVFAVANDPLVRVGPRLTEGLLALAELLHPDLLASP